MKANNEPCGLRGWLILVGIGVVISPIRVTMATLPTFIPIIKNGTWLYFINPNSAYYHPVVIPLLAMELTFDIAMILALLILNYFFFSKHRLFPKLYIVITITSLCIIPLDSWLTSLVFANSPVFDANTARNFMQALVAVAIWVPYMLRSKRVKATFTRGRSRSKESNEESAVDPEPSLVLEAELTDQDPLKE